VADRLGSDRPRIWTPPLRPLTRKTSLGFEAIDFGLDVLGINLYPWQQHLLISGLELHPDFTTAAADPMYRFDTVLVLAARQNGKTETMKVLALWKMYLDRPPAGRTTTVIGTAQDLTTSEKTWDEVVSLAEDVDDLADEITAVDKTNGKKALRLVGKHAYLVKAASRRGARGFTGDLVMLDELREHQTWDSWGASTKTTLARPRSQVWCFSNAGDAASIVLWHLRAQAMLDAEGVGPGELEAFTGALLAEPDEDEEIGSSLGIMEWSAPPGCGKWDRGGWAAANGSMGRAVTERKIAAAAKTDPEWVFRTEVLCQWRPTAAGGPFPDGAWESGIDPLSAIVEGSPLVVCVDVSHDRTMSYIAVAGRRSDGHVHAEIVAMRAGTEWVVPWLTAAERPTWAAITAQTNGAPVSSLLEKPKDETSYRFRRADAAPDSQPVVESVEWSGPELAKASGQLYDLVRLPNADDPADASKRRIYHLPQPVLDLPATSAATRPMGDGWVIDRKKSEHDAAPLVAVFGAVWLLLQFKPPTRSAYEDSDLLVV
jgi:hypothetical protein